MKRLLSIFASLLVTFAAAAAQGPLTANAHVVRGTVFDSVARAALPNAVVQLARIAAGDSTPRIVTTRTDDAGHYRFAGLPNGRYAIGFQHDVLNALGLDSPLRGFELGSDTSVIVDLAIQSGSAVRMQQCGKDAGGPSDGMLAGFVLDAAHDAPAMGATVELRWVETTLQTRGVRAESKQVTATTDDDGHFRACGVPSDAALDVVVLQPGYRKVTGQLTIPIGGALRQDFFLSDSGAMGGTATITGRVVQQDSTVLPSGIMGIDALGLESPIRNGTVSLGGLPPGTWYVELRAIGYEPRTLLVNATNGPPSPIRIVIDKTPQTLEAVSVIGRASPDTRTLSTIIQRSRTSTGTVFLPGNSWLESATHPADVLRAAPGFRYKDQFHVEGSRDCKSVAVYLDGYRMVDLEKATNATPMKSILAIEAYPDINSAPFQFRTRDTSEYACAVVAIWTKR